ncbi:NADP-dependent oxidoreductase [Pseudonocardia sp.]|uniref:NADP-dependent oxidoreductase n=1 Tax=Pseudonocardia sp. TaxID=60912 RepID=UPI003D104488
MKVIETGSYGGPDVLALADREEPVPGPGEVVVRVRAATVNPVDLATRAGAFAAVLSPPFVLGWDLAGEVDGTRVAGMVPWFATDRGAYAEAVAVDREWVAPVPDGVAAVLAATVPLAGLTARQALATLPEGGSLLVTGASGAVGGFAVQLAAQAGAEVYAVASAGDEEWVAGLGAAHVLGRDALSGRLPVVDAVLDAAPAGPELISAVRDGGSFVAVTDPTTPVAERGVRVAKVSVTPDAAALGELLDAVAAGRLRTRVAATFPLADAAAAHRRLAAGGVRGKLVLVP